MIRVPTTFVIGAGASKPYGLPLGGELFAEARSLNPHDDVYQLLLRLPTDVQALNAFLDDLKNFPAQSIDAFLEARQFRPNTIQIGKAMIAALMGRALLRREPSKPSSSEDWLGYIVDRMREGAATSSRDFANRNDGVAFVTFNFDSVVEQRLRHAIEGLFRPIDNHHVGATMQMIPVIHVHGQLPDIPNTKMLISPLDDVDARWVEWTRAAAERVSVVFDSLDAAVLQRARELLERAKVLCFLGFGYHAENLRKLDIQKTLRAGQRRYVFGSAMGLKDGEQQRVRRAVHRDVKLGAETEDCLAVLRRFDIFLG